MAYLEGIDINHWENVVDWTLAGKDFVFVKASEGYSLDSKFLLYWLSLYRTNKLRGAYNYYRPTYDIQQQVKVFHNACFDTQFPPVADIELYSKYTDDLAYYTNTPTKSIQDRIKLYLDEIENKFSRKPILYTCAGFWNKHVGYVSWAKDYKLWVANYEVAQPYLPTGWADWLFWQYTANGAVPGIVGAVDLDYFKGTKDELLKLANVEVTPVPPTAIIPKAEVIVDVLNIRSEPSTASTITGRLVRGNQPECLQTVNQSANVWVRCGWKQWIAMKYNGIQYLKLL